MTFHCPPFVSAQPCPGLLASLGRSSIDTQAGLTPSPPVPSAHGSFPVGEKIGLKVVSSSCRIPGLGLISGVH